MNKPIQPATPLPWSHTDEPVSNPYWSAIRLWHGSAGVAEISLHNAHGQGRANAAYIVAACNAYPELVAALRETLTDQETMREPYRNEAICERARALLARLGAE